MSRVTGQQFPAALQRQTVSDWMHRAFPKRELVLTVNCVNEKLKKEFIKKSFLDNQVS